MAAEHLGLNHGDLEFLFADWRPPMTVRDCGKKEPILIFNRKSRREQRLDGNMEMRLMEWQTSTDAADWKQNLLTATELADFLFRKERYKKQALAVDVDAGKSDPPKSLVRSKQRRNQEGSKNFDRWGEKRWGPVHRNSAGYDTFVSNVIMAKKLREVLWTTGGEVYDMLLEVPEALARPVGNSIDRDRSDTYEVVNFGLNGSDSILFAATIGGKGTCGLIVGVHCFMTNNGEQCCDMSPAHAFSNCAAS